MECRVCADPNGQPHYGTVCCASCKAFFRREFLKNERLECISGNRCFVTQATRKSCRSCRYKKCLEVGVNSNEIRGEKKPSPLSSITTTPSTSQGSTPKVDTELTYEEAVKLSAVYWSLERNCETGSTTSSLTEETENNLIDMMLSCSVSELLSKTTAQCPRFKRCWKPYEMLTIENFVRSWSRSLIHFLDFSTRIPIFDQMGLSDRREWFISRFAPCTFLSMVYYTSIEKREGLLFGCANVFPLRIGDENGPEKTLCGLFSPITETLFSLAVYPMINLKLNETHFGLLKACVFYAQGLQIVSLTDTSIATMRLEYTKHKNALLKILFNNVESFGEQADILFQVEDILSAVERASKHFDEEINYFHLMGLPVAQKKMIIECHVRK